MKKQDDMSERELLPCPFCNGVPEIHTQMVSRYQFVSCSRCNCDGPLKERTSAAISAWNRRSPSRPLILEEAATWRPIESADLELCSRAPCLVAADGAVGEARYFQDEKGWWWTDYAPTDYLDRQCFPSHWMPFPAPPASPHKEKGDE